VDHPDSRHRLVGVLRTALAATDHDLLSDVQYDTAMGGLELVVVAPAEVAELLIERTLAGLPRAIPMKWHRLLADMDVTERTPSRQVLLASPVWTDVVPDLLDAGLGEHAITQLHEGILMDNTDYDLDDATQVRLNVLQPLMDDSRPAVREFGLSRHRCGSSWRSFVG
jgi:hypothetical protein